MKLDCVAHIEYVTEKFGSLAGLGALFALIGVLELEKRAKDHLHQKRMQTAITRFREGMSKWN